MIFTVIDNNLKYIFQDSDKSKILVDLISGIHLLHTKIFAGNHDIRSC